MLKDVYNVELVDRSFGSCGYNAAKKPRLDSSKTLLDNMGHLIPIYVLSDASKNRLFNGIIRRVNILFSIYGFYRKCLKIKDSAILRKRRIVDTYIKEMIVCVLRTLLLYLHYL